MTDTSDLVSITEGLIHELEREAAKHTPSKQAMRAAASRARKALDALKRPAPQVIRTNCPSCQRPAHPIWKGTWRCGWCGVDSPPPEAP